MQISFKAFALSIFLGLPFFSSSVDAGFRFFLDDCRADLAVLFHASRAREDISFSSKRLDFHLMRARDYIDWVGLMNDAREQQWLNGWSQMPLVVSDYFKFHPSRGQKRVETIFAIRERGRNRIIGFMQSSFIRSETESEIHISIDSEFHMKGYGFESVSALMDDFDRRFQITRWTTGIERENRAATKLFQKLGFKMSDADSRVWMRPRGE